MLKHLTREHLTNQFRNWHTITRFLIPILYDIHVRDFFMTKTAFTFEELEAISDLIQFHDDWEELSDRLEVNIETLFGKVCDLQTELNEGASAE